MSARRLIARVLLVGGFAPVAGARQEAPGVVFVGSSIFRRWSALASQMAPLPVRNVALDGGETYEMLGLLDLRVLPLKPKVVAYYAGSNDVDFDESANAIVGRVIGFIDRLEAAQPGTRFMFVSIIESPDHQDRWKVIEDVNRQMQKYAAAHPLVSFVDINPVFFNPNGSSRFEMFVADQRHLRPAAYEAVAKIVKPVLTALVAGSEDPALRRRRDDDGDPARR